MRDLSNEIELILGARGTGKTPYIVGDAEYNIRGLLVENMESGRPAIILDQLYHPKYEMFPVIPKEKLITSKIKKGIYRIIEPTRKGMREAQAIIAARVTGTDVICEDSFRYERKQLSDPMAAIVGNSKNIDVNVRFMYHTWKFVPLDLYPYVDKLTLYKTASPPGPREEDELADRYPQVLQCYKEVNKNKDPYFYKSIIVTQ